MRSAVVLDDTPEDRAPFAVALRGSGFEVLEAETDEEALELAHRSAPALIIANPLLAGRDGDEFVLAENAVFINGGHGRTTASMTIHRGDATVATQNTLSCTRYGAGWVKSLRRPGRPALAGRARRLGVRALIRRRPPRFT